MVELANVLFIDTFAGDEPLDLGGEVVQEFLARNRKRYLLAICQLLPAASQVLILGGVERRIHRLAKQRRHLRAALCGSPVIWRLMGNDFVAID